MQSRRTHSLYLTCHVLNGAGESGRSPQLRLLSPSHDSAALRLPRAIVTASPIVSHLASFAGRMTSQFGHSIAVRVLTVMILSHVTNSHLCRSARWFPAKIAQAAAPVWQWNQEYPHWLQTLCRVSVLGHHKPRPCPPADVTSGSTP